MTMITTLRMKQLPFDLAKSRALGHIKFGRRSLSAVAQYLIISTVDCAKVLDALIADGAIEKISKLSASNHRKTFYAIKDDLAILDIPMFRVAIPHTDAKPKVHHETHSHSSGLRESSSSLTGGMYSILQTLE